MMQVKDLTLRAGDRVLVPQVSFRVQEGECLLLCGPNGSGKSTLLRTLAAKYAGCELIPTGIPKVKGFTVEQFLQTSCYRNSSWLGALAPATARRIEAALEILQLQKLRAEDLSNLSDGEFQKVCIALGLARHARILLLDEPSAFLDVDNRISVFRTLEQTARQSGMAVIFSSHDLHDALSVAHRVLAILPGGSFAESEPQNREEVIHLAFPFFK